MNYIYVFETDATDGIITLLAQNMQRMRLKTLGRDGYHDEYDTSLIHHR